jgi:hypothetical protein
MIGVCEKKPHSLQELKDTIPRETAYISKTTVPLYIKIWAHTIPPQTQKVDTCMFLP